MTCHHPLRAFKLLSEKTENGKNQIVFNRQKTVGKVHTEISIPCGQCIGCRIDKSKEWSIRCVNEAQLYENNCFITLTFNEENLNGFESLDATDFQRFMKRLRKKFAGAEFVKRPDGTYHRPIRFFHCGEYGEKLSRPHHHACLFNFDFEDKVLWKEREGVLLYRSAELEKLWPYGFCTVGEVTYQSAAYVARYVTKKINGKKAKNHYQKVNMATGEVHQIEPEQITMSRRPGIGKMWFEEFQSDVFPKDFITHQGRRFRTPKYYDALYDALSPEEFEKIQRKRRKEAKKYPDQKTLRRLRDKEKVLQQRVKRLERTIE